METRKNSFLWLTHLLNMVILIMGLVACASSDESVDEPLKPDTKINDGDWETIPTGGGTIEKGDITIQFPSGTFSGDTKVAVSEVNKGQICGDDEVSKFYQITLPYTCGKPFTVKIKCDEKGEDINAIVHAPAMAVGPYKQIYADCTIESTNSNGEYTFTIPSSGNQDVTDNASLSVGIAKIRRILGESAGTRAVGGISWHYDISVFHQQKNLDNWKKADYPGSIKSALQHLQDLGFTISGSRNLPVSFVVEENEDMSGHLVQSKWNDIFNGIALNDLYITDFDRYNAKNPVKRTCIHELTHYYQSVGYDPRWPVVKMATDGDERMIYECAAVWSEKFNDGGSPSLGFVSQYLPRFLTSLTEVKKAHEGDKESKNPYADHGYGMAALIEYLTTQRKSEGFKDNSVVELYEIMKSSSAGLGTKLSGTTFDFLKAWAKQHNSKFFEDDGYDDFILKLMTGKVYTEMNPYQAVNGANDRLKEDGEITARSQCYPYGAYINRLNLMSDNDNTQFKNSGSLTNKQLVVEQIQDGVQTYVVAQYQGGLKQIDGKAIKGSPIVIDGKTLESFRKGDNYNVNIYAISTNCKNQSALPTEVNLKLEDAQEAEIQSLNVDFQLWMDDSPAFPGVDNRSPFWSGDYWESIFYPRGESFDKATVKKGKTSWHVEAEKSWDDPASTKIKKAKYTASFDLDNIDRGYPNAVINNLVFTSYESNGTYEVTQKLGGSNIIFKEKYENGTSISATYENTESKGIKKLSYTSSDYKLLDNDDNRITIGISFKTN